MNVYIAKTNAEPLDFLPDLPPGLEQYKVFEDCKTITRQFGTIIMQTMPQDGFTILYCVYLIKDPVVFDVIADGPLLKLHVGYKNDLELDILGMGKVKLEEGQFNICYLPEAYNLSFFEPGKYETFSIIYSMEYLNRFAMHLPTLYAFLKKVETNTPCFLNESHYIASPEMKGVIRQTFDYRYCDELSLMYFESKSLELLSLAIRSTTQEIRLTPAFLKTLQQVKVWLDENSSSPGTLRDLARNLNTNEIKLRKGFRQLYGVTVFEYLLNLRMINAKKQVLETDKQLSEIAYLTGYSNPSHFTTAFKKHFGYPPNDLRK